MIKGSLFTFVLSIYSLSRKDHKYFENFFQTSLRYICYTANRALSDVLSHIFERCVATLRMKPRCFSSLCAIRTSQFGTVTYCSKQSMEENLNKSCRSRFFSVEASETALAYIV